MFVALRDIYTGPELSVESGRLKAWFIAAPHASNIPDKTNILFQFSKLLKQSHMMGLLLELLLTLLPNCGLY
jgi:hypothetical protein